ncbi:hypothetical protein [Bergeriella denitrificans]|nr:hypothetical protein [Bergeriella denitrificans]
MSPPPEDGCVRPSEKPAAAGCRFSDGKKRAPHCQAAANPI